MAEVKELKPCEPVRVDKDCLSNLFGQLSESGAQDVVCRTVEELAVRLAQCDLLWRKENWGDLRKCARSLIAISDQVGMATLARVAGDVTHTIDNCDLPAIAATLRRLIRIGERSLTAVWDLRDLSV